LNETISREDGRALFEKLIDAFASSEPGKAKKAAP
jgi:hypothetical protein